MGLLLVLIMFILFHLRLSLIQNKVTVFTDNFLFLDKDNPELARAWRLLPDGNPVAENSGEVWQYMGTELNGNGGQGWYHCFRHRCYRDEGRVYRFFPVSGSWMPPTGRMIRNCR